MTISAAEEADLSLRLDRVAASMDRNGETLDQIIDLVEELVERLGSR